VISGIVTAGMVSFCHSRPWWPPRWHDRAAQGPHSAQQQRLQQSPGHELKEAPSDILTDLCDGHRVDEGRLSSNDFSQQKHQKYDRKLPNETSHQKLSSLVDAWGLEDLALSIANPGSEIRGLPILPLI